MSFIIGNSSLASSGYWVVEPTITTTVANGNWFVSDSTIQVTPVCQRCHWNYSKLRCGNEDVCYACFAFEWSQSCQKQLDLSNVEATKIYKRVLLALKDPKPAP